MVSLWIFLIIVSMSLYLLFMLLDLLVSLEQALASQTRRPAPFA